MDITKSFKILVVDDKENIRKLLDAHLSGEGYSVDTADSGEAGLEQFSLSPYDLVITDVKMPGMDGLEVLRRVKDISPDTVVLLITAFADMDDAIAAMKMGAFDYLKKPFKLEELQACVEKALENRRLVAENRLLREEVEKKYSFENIIAKSASMQEVFVKISRVASSSSTVLITGETGTGKELVARALHYNSPRRRGPLVVVNCGAIPVNLVESELFGHVRGAFTDAVATKQGKFEEADGGTLFLDEIGELDAAVQVKLLRALQEGEISRVGDPKSRKVDVRVICATNRDLEEEVYNGRFRKDLFYRINVVPIHIPPLCERMEDVPLLLRHFLDQFSRDAGRGEMVFTPRAMSKLLNYRWPGNVRELMNIMERCALMSEVSEIDVDDLPAGVAGAAAVTVEQSAGGKISIDLPVGEFSLKDIILSASEVIEREMIDRALKAAEGNRDKAAAMLGISRRSLFYKLKEYGS